jgi:hypothetical protein
VALAAGVHAIGRRAHEFGVLEREDAPEHAESGEHGALGGGEQVVAPVEQRPQRAVARQRGAPAAREHGEHVVEPGGQLLDTKRRHLRGGELEGERQAVEPRADRGHVGCRLRGEREAGLHRARTLDEERGRFVAGDHGRERLGRPPGDRPPAIRVGRARIDRRVREPGHRPHGLALHTERLAAGGEQREPRAAPQQQVGQRGRAVHDVLAVVEHEEEAARRAGGAAECGGQDVGEDAGFVGAGRMADAEDRRHGGRGIGVRRERGEIDPPHAVGEGRPASRRPPRRRTRAAGCARRLRRARGLLAGEARLSRPAGAGERDQPCAPQQLADLVEVTRPPDEVGEGGRHIVGGVRWSVRQGARCGGDCGGRDRHGGGGREAGGANQAGATGGSPFPRTP